jgi:hypothetical protein
MFSLSEPEINCRYKKVTRTKQPTNISEFKLFILNPVCVCRFQKEIGSAVNVVQLSHVVVFVGRKKEKRVMMMMMRDKT